MAGFLVVAVALAAGIDTLASKIFDSPKTTASDSPVTCSGRHASRQVEIKANAMVPALTTAKLCDTLTITNHDTADRLVAFGQHYKHVPYDGVAEQLLKPGDGFTITLNKVGVVHFHDHLDDIAQGDFTVTN